MPGAQLTEIVNEDYHGTVRVKVGPVVAQYGGVARFLERDPARHHAVLEAKGKERNGRGLASAHITADLQGDGDSTRVRVSTELTISGPLAQFGRGAIAEVSGKLLGQFVDRLRETVLAGGPAGPAPATAPVQPPPPSEPAPAAEPPAAEPPSPAQPVHALPPVAMMPTPGLEPPVAMMATPDLDSTGAASPADSAAWPVSPAEPGAPADADDATEPEPEPTAEPAPSRRIVASAQPEPADLLKVAGGPILKRLVPLLIVLAIVVVLLVIWLG
jgi:uncharacterized protein